MAKPPTPVELPTDEPVTLEEALLFLRLDTSGTPATHPDDDLVRLFLSAARGAAENYTNSAIAYRTYNVAYDDWNGDFLSLKTWPVPVVNSVQYYDRNGVLQTLDSSEYILDDFHQPARLTPVTDWPEIDDRPNAILIEFEAGYTYDQSPDTFPLPRAIKSAILLILGHLYENRQDVTYQQHHRLPMGSEYLLQPYRISMGL